MMQINPTELQPNEVLFNGKYTIETLIGKNDFGFTYLAKQEGESDWVCVLQYWPQNIAEEEWEASNQQFVDDARMLAEFDHENIVKVLALFAENDTVYMVIPFIENGLTQKEFLKVSNELPLYVPEMVVTKEYLQSQGVADELLPRKPHFLYLPDYKVMLVHFGAVQVFNNVLPEEGNSSSTTLTNQAETETVVQPQTQKTETTKTKAENTPMNPPIEKEDVAKMKEIQRLQRQKYANAPLACPTCKRPMPICICKRNKCN